MGWEHCAQIRSDYEPLAQAAQKAVRLACQVPLQNKINRPEVVISLPVVFGFSH